MLLCPQLSRPSFGRELLTTDPNKVKAALIRNFAHYVTWPPDIFSAPDSPWRISILAVTIQRRPFGDVLEKTVQGRTEQERRRMPKVSQAVFKNGTLRNLRCPPCCEK